EVRFLHLADAFERGEIRPGDFPGAENARDMIRGSGKVRAGKDGQVPHEVGQVADEARSSRGVFLDPLPRLAILELLVPNGRKSEYLAKSVTKLDLFQQVLYLRFRLPYLLPEPFVYGPFRKSPVIEPGDELQRTVDQVAEIADQLGVDFFLEVLPRK